MSTFNAEISDSIPSSFCDMFEYAFAVAAVATVAAVALEAFGPFAPSLVAEELLARR